MTSTVTAPSERGMSLVEVIVSTFLVALLFLAALSMLEIDQRVYLRDDAVLAAAGEAEHALELLERDLLMVGYQVDVRTIADVGADGTVNTDDDVVGQAKIVYAAPWELVVNADIADDVEAIIDGVTGDSTPTGYAPVSFFTGAETIRFTLDSSGDGTINTSDRGDDVEEHTSFNPSLYSVYREVYGGRGGANIVDTTNVGLIRGPDAYPNGTRPTPLFQYWGDFDTDPALDLWGDTGAGGGVSGNGVLEAGEIAAMTAVTDEDANDNGILDTGEDRNGNGSLETRVSELITEIDVRITGETVNPDLKWNDPRLASSTAKYPYRQVSVGTRIRPRNIELPGGACGDEPEPTSSVSVVNACPDALADGKVTLAWTVSDDDGANETDIERYLVYRTDVDNIFGPTPFSEVVAGTSTYQDDWIDARSWPPRQYWYRLRAMDCTPALSVSDPVAGPYPADVGPMFPLAIDVRDMPGDDGSQLEVRWSASHDDPVNTTGYGDDVAEYHIHRSTLSDYRCVAPVNDSAIPASGAAEYTWVDSDTYSSSAIVLGELYYYWMRSVDAANAVSPYSQRTCARAYEGPVMPTGVLARVATYSSTDHPAELWFTPPEENPDAGYDPYQIEYKVYRSRDINGDGLDDSLVDDSVGYKTTDYADSAFFTGVVWTVGDTAACGFHSFDGTATWRSMATDSVAGLKRVRFRDRLRGVAVGDGGVVIRTDTGGATAAAATSGVVANLHDAAWATDARVFAVGDTGTMIQSDDGGATWSTVTLSIASTLYGLAAREGSVVAVGDSGTVQLSTDFGLTWAAPASAPSDDLKSACIYGGVSGATIVVGGQDRIWRSSDLGTSWSATALPGGITGDVIALSCVDPGVVMAVSDDGASSYVFSSSDGGATLGLESTSLGGRAADVGVVDATLAYVADDAGYVHYKQPNGTWLATLADATCALRGVAVLPIVVWESTATKGDASGDRYYFVVTSKYAVGDATLDGESGLLADRGSTFEDPDDALAQVLVDSCRNFEATAVQP